jgi:uncharacterized protein (DUF4415 family)
MSNRPLTDQETAELRKLAELPDAEIDTSDIAEISDEQWQLARKGHLYRPLKQPVTIRLDADVVAWFKEHSGGRGYQTGINNALRAYIAASGKRR